MQAVTIPLLYCPFSPAIHPQVKEAAIHTDAWVASFHLHTGTAYQQYQADKFAWLGARCYPEAALEQLQIANDFMVLLFALGDLLDDQRQRSQLTEKPEQLSTLVEHFIAVIHHRHLPVSKATTPVLAAWADLWPRIERISPATGTARLAQGLTALLHAALSESGHKRKQQPSVAQYMAKRPYLAGAAISTGIIPIIEGIWLADEVLQHPVLTELEQLSHNLLCWSNDLFSFSKEQADGDAHNLVSILQQERGLTLDEALLCVAAIYNTDMRRFVALSRQLPAFDAATDQAVAKYVDALRRHIRGHIDWSEKDSGRYSFVYGRS